MISRRRLAMARRMIGAADDLRSRWTLASYFVRRALPGDGGAADLSFRLCGVDWRVQAAAAQLGGIHDVWLGREYDAFDGFRAPPGGRVVDIGANVGAFTLWQARHTGPTGTVVAVEANPDTAAVLRRNLDANPGAEVAIVGAAVWREHGTVDFAASARATSTAGVSETLPESLRTGTSTQRIDAVTLADVFDHAALDGGRVDVTKIDVEGAEVAVLEGADAETLRRSDRYLVEIDERTAPDVDRLLSEAGFRRVGRSRNVTSFERPVDDPPG